MALNSWPECAAQVMEHLCSHANHGYSQTHRGQGGTERITLSDGTKVNVPAWDMDCSYATIGCYKWLGINVGGATWTGDMIACMVNQTSNFKLVRLSERKRGDILLTTGHTELYLGDGKQAGFRGDEVGGITGPTWGDQTGHESEIRAYTGLWKWCIRYCGPARPGASPTPVYGNLVVDGILGVNSVSELQRRMGTFVDGVITGQVAANAKWYPNLLAVRNGSGGSACIRALQRKVSSGIDGIIGQQTIKKLQAYLTKQGYSVAQDGVLGPYTAKAMQKALNAKKI